MKIALLADTHHGVRNDTAAFYDPFESFYQNTFFPTLKKRGIQNILHFGDVFDRRKYINFQTLEKTRAMFFEPMKRLGINMKVILGNHDVFYRSTNRLNSVSLLLGEYVDNSDIYENPVETTIYGMDCVVMPWINADNYDAAMQILKTARGSKPVFGHLEITGFNMYKNSVCDHGLDPKLFNRFDTVLTGHFHHQSHNGSVRYLGAPYEMIWADYDDPRGFHIMDTETLELEFIPNPEKMFYRVRYDDSNEIPGETKPGPDVEPSVDWKGKYIKIVVIRKKDPYAFDQFMESVWETQPHDVSLVEDESLDIDKVFDTKDETLIIDDTPKVLNAYVDAINNVDVNKPGLKKLMLELYTEAVASIGRD